MPQADAARFLCQAAYSRGAECGASVTEVQTSQSLRGVMVKQLLI